MTRGVDPEPGVERKDEKVSWGPKRYPPEAWSVPLIPRLDWLKFASDEEIFQQAIVRNLIVPWGVECEDCGATFYGEDFRKPCLACRSKNLTPLYAGRPNDAK